MARRTVFRLLARLSVTLVLVHACAAPTPPADVDVLTNRYNNARTGANSRETTLTPRSVNVEKFGKVFERDVDGDVYAQPLIKTGVNILGVGLRNVVFVATTNNSLYAFDADRAEVQQPYWRITSDVFGLPVPRSEVSRLTLPDEYRNFEHTVGIVSTPVIDDRTGTIYVLAKSKSPEGGYRHRLHAFDLAVGREKTEMGSPAGIDVSAFGPDGQSVNSMDHRTALNRPGLLLHDGVIYVAFAAHGDDEPRFDYHGWIIAYDASTLRQIAVFCTTPDGKQGGIWQSGSGLSAERKRHGASAIYAVVGNGATGGTNFGQSILQLRPSPVLDVSRAFVPEGALEMNELDLDMSTGAALIPGTSLLVACSKAGSCYVLDRSSMRLRQVFQAASNGMQASPYTNIHGTPVLLRNGRRSLFLYVWGEEDHLRSYRLAGKTFALAGTSAFSAPPNSMPGGMLSASSNGAKKGTGVIWASVPLRGDANNSTVEGILRAFDASDLSRELWNSSMNDNRDRLGMFAKFCPPVVANGKVYMPTFASPLSESGEQRDPAGAKLVVYGLLNASAESANQSRGLLRLIAKKSLSATGKIARSMRPAKQESSMAIR